MTANAKAERTEIEVLLDADFLSAPMVVGTLFRVVAHGREVFSFRYDSDWRRSKSAVGLDPQLVLGDGEFYPEKAAVPFRVFLDSAPDRWGRVLMDRREEFRARAAGRSTRTLTELDYLLGVHDMCRLGALRFRREASAPFLDNDAEFAAPPITSLRELEAAARALEDPKASENANYAKWLKLLLEPGSSLGGARPKSVFADVDGSFWIAKFPSRNDRRDVGAWEFLVHTLADRAGLDVPAAKLFPGADYRTFACQRFDRIGSRRRFFVSAMTLLGRNDGDAASYLDIAELISVNVGPTASDLRELWTRLVFNILVGNRDDHLRNHGFIMVGNVWRLAPAYDVNPNIEKSQHALRIDDRSAVGSVDLALETAALYGLKAPAARSIVDQVSGVVAGWRQVAEDLKISRPEIEMMAPAFLV